MLKSISLVIILLIAFDVFVSVTGLPVPGAVPAMLVLALLCSAHPDTNSQVSRLFDGIIPVAPMLFVPAAVGIIAKTEAIALGWLPIVLAITVSTALALLVTGATFQVLLRLHRRVAGS